MDFGLEKAGFEPALFCEASPFRRRILAKHWSGVPILPDVVHADWSPFRGSVDAIAGGFPCQPASTAGRRRGALDHRWLWPAYARAIEELEPKLVIIENVPGLLSAVGSPEAHSLWGPRFLGRRYEARPGGAFAAVLLDLALLGFDAEWTVLSASAFGAPHIRRRLFVVAYADPGSLREQQQRDERGEAEHGHPKPEHPGGLRAASHAPNPRLPKRLRRSDADPSGEHVSAGRSCVPHVPDSHDSGRVQQPTRHGPKDGVGIEPGHDPDGRSVARVPRPGVAHDAWAFGPPFSALRRVDDGSSSRLDRPRLAALGDGVVSQCAEFVGRAALREYKIRACESPF
jgi:DNA (cytosine-5)-methyltransferase 1